MYNLLRCYVRLLSAEIDRLVYKMAGELNNPEQRGAYSEKIRALKPILLLANRILEGYENEKDRKIIDKTRKATD